MNFGSDPQPNPEPIDLFDVLQDSNPGRATEPPPKQQKQADNLGDIFGLAPGEKQEEPGRKSFQPAPLDNFFHG